MENPLSLNPPLCEAFSPSWLRFSFFSLTSINTLVTFQVFPTLRSGLTASRLLIQHHACFFAFYPCSLGYQREEERMKILSPVWVPGMLDRPLPHAFLRPPEAEDRVSLTGKWTKSGLTLNFFTDVKQDLEVVFYTNIYPHKASYCVNSLTSETSFLLEPFLVETIDVKNWLQLAAHIVVCIPLCVDVNTFLLRGSVQQILIMDRVLL